MQETVIQSVRIHDRRNKKIRGPTHSSIASVATPKSFEIFLGIVHNTALIKPNFCYDWISGKAVGSPMYESDWFITLIIVSGCVFLLLVIVVLVKRHRRRRSLNFRGKELPWSNRYFSLHCPGRSHIVLFCIFWRDTLPSQCLPTQRYKWVRSNLMLEERGRGEGRWPCDRLAPIQGGLEIPLVISCRGNGVGIWLN